MLCQVIFQALSAIFEGLFGVIVVGLESLIGDWLIGTKLKIVIILATHNLLIKICVDFSTYLACLLIGIITGGYIKLYLGKNT